VAEINDLISQGFVYAQVTGNVFNSPGMANTRELEFTAGEFDFITFVSMIAPSPDWFVSETYDLHNDLMGEWEERVEIDLLSYDAGTDSGTELSSLDSDTQPKEAITMLDEEWQNMGKIILTRIDS